MGHDHHHSHGDLPSDSPWGFTQRDTKEDTVHSHKHTCGHNKLLGKLEKRLTDQFLSVSKVHARPSQPPYCLNVRYPYFTHIPIALTNLGFNTGSAIICGGVFLVLPS